MAEVALVGCDSYSGADVSPAVVRMLDAALAGRIREVEGKRVLVKPNLLAAREPSRGITTHPAIVGAVIDYLVNHGARVSVGDSPAGAVRGVRRVWEKTGMLDVCEARGVDLVNMEASGSVARRAGSRTYEIAAAAVQADLVVNVAKFKTHVLTLLTGAIKNMFGCVPGFRKSSLHLAFPGPVPMSKALVDIFSLVPPWLSVVDAVVGMDGNGPSSGRLRDLGFLAASTDSVAVDAVLALIAGIDPLRVPTTAEACRRNLGEGSPGRIRFPCLRPDQVAPEEFKVPGNWKFMLIPGFLGRLVLPFVWVRPAIDPAVCTGCGECTRVCAAGAVKVEAAKAVVRERLCVSCLCCHEACPTGAVGTKRSFLARFVH
jgi:uncharacterized protein (DUF362 family)/Pyruvate/2-oxoacid:ferredoxin oxidoreductase delta subunit